MEKKISAFLGRHNFPVEMSVYNTVNSLLYDMNLGLFGADSVGNCDENERAGEDMFKTWILPPENSPKNKSVIVIDAGGTNFRSCLVSFDSDGKASISDFKKTKMPGVEKELSKKEFFAQIADNIEYLRDKSNKIGFCFSYAMSITKDGDGIPNAFSKEIKAPEVIGVPVGKTLVEELENRGWNKISRITLLNDTVAALLAGAASCGEAKYSSYIGFILGTGMNAAYIQPEKDGVENQIIVCEAGKCDKIPLSDFDVSLDKKTNIPGQYRLEKGCSGAYIGKLCYEMILKGAEEHLFTKATCENILKLNDLTLIEVDKFLYSPLKDGVISSLCACDEDRRAFYDLFAEAVDRTARYAASILCANAIQSEAGIDCLHPICILCNGTTFYKTHKLRMLVESYVYEFLTRKNGVHFEIVSVDDDITLGTAVAGLI